MRITNRTRDTLLGRRIRLASTWMGRFRGHFGRTEPGDGEGILLTSCNAVHSYFTSFALDVLFLDDRGRVLDIIRSFPPRKKSRRVAGARYVLGVPQGTVDSSDTEIGDVLGWREPAYSLSVLFQDRNRPGAA